MPNSLSRCCISAAVSVPAALLVEGRALPALWASAAAGYPAGSLGLAGQVAATGLYFYGYSEVAMKALNNVHPVTHAIGNTMRRVLHRLRHGSLQRAWHHSQTQ